DLPQGDPLRPPHEVRRRDPAGRGAGVPEPHRAGRGQEPRRADGVPVAGQEDFPMREVKWPYGWGRVGYAWEDREPWLHLPFPIAEWGGGGEGRRGGRRERGREGRLAHGTRAERAPIRYLSNFEDYYSGDTLMVIPLAGPVGLTTNAVMHGEP